MNEATSAAPRSMEGDMDLCCKEARQAVKAKDIMWYEGWNVPGCCGGGCYVLMNIKHCPFCGKELPKEITP